MAHYGDPEAHRCILEEVSAIPAAPRLNAYLKAAMMGSQGSDVGLQELRHFPGDHKQQDPHLEVMLALLSLTVLASKAHPGFRAEQKRVQDLIRQKQAALRQQAEQIKSARSCSGAGPSAFASRTGVTSLPAPFSSSDVSSASPAAVASAAVEGKEEKLTPVQRWEQSTDILNYCEAYANYLGGFTELWYELFGPNYYYDVAANGVFDEDDDVDDREGAWTRLSEAGEWASTHSPVFPLSSSPQHSRHHQQQQHARRRQRPLRAPQVPPHLYAVHWSDILTPQRRAWFHGLHNAVKELLVRILHRELPLELYILFIQYANLSLRVYLLQTLAEVFEWTSHFVDVIYYVHVMRQSYSIQCEMSQLQRVWSSFGLYDGRFLADCREFNKMYTESQGAFSEQWEVVPGKPPTAPQAAAVTTALVSTAIANIDITRHSSSVTPETTACPSSSTVALSAGSATTLSSDLAVIASARVQRMFPFREAAGNTSFDAADSSHTTGSRTPDDEGLSSASDCEAVDSAAGGTKRAVYLPLFYTCCCFTWILQRTFWSMYGRCSLLLESCLGVEVAPQVLSVDGPGEVNGGDASVLFATAQRGVQRRIGVIGSSGLPSSPASPASPIPRNDGGAAARTRSASTSAISITITRNNVTSRLSAFEVPTRDGGGATAGRPPQTAQVPSHCTASSPPSQKQSGFLVGAAKTQGPPHVVADGSQADAVEMIPTWNAVAPELVDERGRDEGARFSWGSVLDLFVQRGQRRHGCGATTEGGSGSAGDTASMTQRPHRISSFSLATPAGTPPPAPAAGTGARGERMNSLFLKNSGAPFHLQYTHRAREIQLYDDPSVTFTNGSADNKDANALFFEEFYFLRETGCYVLSHAVRNLTCYPRYPATLLILTDNTTRPGRVSWCDHKFSVLSSPTDDGDGRQGLTPWVLSAVIPHTRLSSIRSVRARQEEALLKHVVFQVAGAKSARVRFCTSNSIFFVLNCGSEMDGGRLYFALHLHVNLSARKQLDLSIDTVMETESQWAFRALGELHVSWAMSCTCNEALRVAFQIGPGEGVS
ncbi:conserved hypothetical protein [Leishmania mexicana MHOM/GT/2001/U1103]|uniref:Uncharacterized protein n=1 Tax=Leishmania mexicana (strain MHOM/GT/2001/U1103) TaxID=929439 RepID=E9B6U1_LEIMU|nr:conserved hypothetical protein [Leishmania mexicana MHOM/GT/2001/U1103]CBZ30964.1 conserved hypothetical protein [Leishmania mexicana MHOM/GT/2001/U1103]